jgi:selenocysteine lyase/cysteine desulfurase
MYIRKSRLADIDLAFADDDCVRVTTALFIKPADLDRLVAALKTITAS